MSEVVDKAIAALRARLGSDEFDGSACLEIEGEGCLRIDGSDVSADDAEADVRLTADAETFEGLLGGDLDATSAFMTGKLKVDGDMSIAMKLAALLS